MSDILLTTAAVVLSMLNDAEPGTSPYRSLYAANADAIATVANASPLFAGPDGPLKSAAVYASLQWFESNGNVAAEGDCRFLTKDFHCDTARPDKGDPQSFGLYQIGRSNFAFLDVTKEAMTGDAVAQTWAAQKMITVSFGVCRGRPEDELLTQYASGGGACTDPKGIVKSRHRMLKSKWLFSRAKAKKDQ